VINHPFGCMGLFVLCPLEPLTKALPQRREEPIGDVDHGDSRCDCGVVAGVHDTMRRAEHL